MKDFSTFSHTGLHLDLRIQVPPPAALRKLAEECAGYGFNTLMVEWEATFPFRKHAIISNRYAYTRREMEGFIKHCVRLGIEVVPLQQCFGHIEYILQHARYANLRESARDFCQLCPCRSDEARETFRDIFEEIAALHPSPFIHIGGDETYLLGHCAACRAKAEKRGKSVLYIDHLKNMAQLVTGLGKRPLVWADMLLKYPEALGKLPPETVLVDWNYGWRPDHFGDWSILKNSGHEIWGAPALRSHPDNHSLTDWRTHFNNLRDFIPFARKAGYRGMILTSWSTSGIYGHHWEKPGEVIDLLPMRRVYPLSGFRLLRAAFAEAVRKALALRPRSFTRRYASDRFGLSSSDGERLWEALMLASPIPGGRVSPGLAARSAKAKQILHVLRPTQNRTEFAHLRLMIDFREIDLRFQLVEQRVQDKAFTSAHVVAVRPHLVRLLREGKKLWREYDRLNRDSLFPAEISDENAYRIGKMQALYDRLNRSGRRPAKQRGA